MRPIKQEQKLSPAFKNFKIKRKFMKKYEYRFSVKAGFNPINQVPKPAVNNIQTEELGKQGKEILQLINDDLGKFKDIIADVRLYLKDLNDKQEDKHRLSLSIPFIKKFLNKDIQFTEKRLSASKLDNEGILDNLLNILKNTIEVIQFYQEQIGREIEKTVPNYANMREVARKILRNPDIAFGNNRFISLNSFLQDFFRQADFDDEKWQGNISTGQYRNFEHNLLFLLDLLSVKKEVLKGSLNRATVNKSYTPTQLKIKIKKIKQEITASVSKFLLESDSKILNSVFDDVKRNFSEHEEKVFDLQKTTLQEATDKLKKLYKICFKKRFYARLEEIYKKEGELTMNLIKEDLEIQQVLPFMFDMGNFNKKQNYVRNFLNAKAQHLADKNNEDKARQAGEFMTKMLISFPSDFVKVKNKLARRYGNWRAKVKTLDNMRFTLSHLVLLAFDKEHDFKSKNLFLVFIPKILLNDYRQLLRNSVQNPTHSIYELHSLTFDALKDKLLAKNMSELLPYLNTEKHNEKVAIFVLKMFLCKFVLNNQKCAIKMSIGDGLFTKINEIFWKNKKKFLRGFMPDDLKNKILQNVILPKHTTLEKFKIALENNYYYFERENINLTNFISSLQEELRNSGEEISWRNRENNIFVGKATFKNIRNRRYIFDLQNLLDHLRRREIDIERLNPEVTLFFNEREPGRATHTKSRFNKDRFSVQLNYTFNKPGKVMRARFADDEQLMQEYERFNTEIETILQREKQDKRHQYLRVGIDIGTQDFISVAFFDDWEKDRNIKRQGFPFKKVKFYKLKNVLARAYLPDKPEPIILYKNPSYFIHSDECKRAFKDKECTKRVEPPDYLEELESYYFESSTAKVIDNKIVLNADIATYYRFQLIPVFMKLDRDRISIDNIPPGYQIKREKGKIILQPSGKAYPFPLPEELKTLADDELRYIIKEQLLNLYKKFNSSNLYELEFFEVKLRNSVAANLSAIFANLLTKYILEIFVESEPDKFLIDHEMKKYSKKKASQSISREFIWALLRKMQKYELTPPKLNRQHLARQIKIHEKGEMHKMRFGNIHFISAIDTSVLCPVCLNKRKDKESPCNKCGFSFKNNNYGIPNADILASCNIANPDFVEIVSNKKVKK